MLARVDAMMGLLGDPDANLLKSSQQSPPKTARNLVRPRCSFICKVNIECMLTSIPLAAASIFTDGSTLKWHIWEIFTV